VGVTRASRSLPPGYFEDLYSRDPDPWRFADSAYERAKYDATLAALPRARYARGLEVGCSIGVLTRDLARLCDALLALDAVEAPLAAARARCADLPHVAFRRARAPQEWPEEAGPFELMVLSEVVYYLDATDVVRLAKCVGGALAPGADLLLVHWTGETNYPLSGDEAAERFIAATAPFAAVRQQGRTERYRLDLLRARAEEPISPVC
jgi:SAM-dependent methyltransferase